MGMLHQTISRLLQQDSSPGRVPERSLQQGSSSGATRLQEANVCDQPNTCYLLHSHLRHSQTSTKRKEGVLAEKLKFLLNGSVIQIAAYSKNRFLSSMQEGRKRTAESIIRL